MYAAYTCHTYIHMMKYISQQLYAGIHADYEYITQSAVADDNKGHIVNFLKFFVINYDIFLRKKRGKIFLRDFFELLLVPTRSPHKWS